MRVLYLTHNYPRFAGDPSGAFIEELLKVLPQNGVQPYVLCPHAKGLPDREERDGVSICRFRYAPEKDETLAYEGKMLTALSRGAKGFFLLLSFIKYFAREARRIAEKERTDLFHAHWLLPGGVVARLALVGLNLPLLLSSHGTDVRMLRGLPLGGQLARWVLKRTQLVLPVSGYLGEQLDRQCGRSLPKAILPMPASDMFFAPARKRLTKRVVVVGNLTPQKRFDVLIRALGILVKKTMALELLIVGDGPERKKLEELGKKERVTVHFLGRRPHHELPGILKDAGVMILPSVAEGFGIVLVEAQLAGLAVIGSDAGGQREIIENGNTGLLVEPDNAEVLANAIETLYSNEKKTLLMAREGQKIAKLRFLALPAAKRLTNIYRKVLG